MKARYRLTCRHTRGGTFYSIDSTTGKRTSLDTCDEGAAQRIVNAMNEAECQPFLNRQLGKAYLLGGDSTLARRTWRDAMTALTDTKLGTNKERWITAQKDKAFVPLWSRLIVETQG